MLNRKNLILIVIGVFLSIILFNTSIVFADDTTYVSLSDDNITVNNQKISEDTSESIYLTNKMNNGGSSDVAKEANKEIENVININKAGTYEFTGELSEGQISVNANNIQGDVVIVLNNAHIVCEKAPGIIVYNKETKSSTCNVIIKTAKNSTNTITAKRLKQSVEGWENQDELLYYVEKGYDDDGTYFEKYKYNGAISSDISLTFEGEGKLTINASKEGIEVKRDITINSGEYVVNAEDDGINACADGESVITINGGTVLVNVVEEAEEGDGIDSNGYIYINGGTVYAFASETSEDSGLDSDLGIYINGGTVVATGNMADEISKDSKQKFILIEFTSKVEKDSLITILDKDKNPMAAFRTDRDYKVLAISTPEISDENFLVYEGGEIEGTSENGLYTKISSYTEGTEKEYRQASGMGKMGNFDRNIVENDVQNEKVYIYTAICLAIILIVLIIVALITKKKGKIIFLFIGILAGAIIATVGFMIYNKVAENNRQETFEQQMQNNMERMEKPDNLEMPMERNQEGEPPEMPNNGEMMEKPDKKIEEQTT